MSGIDTNGNHVLDVSEGQEEPRRRPPVELLDRVVSRELDPASAAVELLARHVDE